MAIGSKKKEKKAVVVGQIRTSQLITTFGSGAIADMPDYSVIMAGTDRWKEYSPKLKERSLERMLHVGYFKQPYASEDSDYAPDIPAFRFPYMHFCPNCHDLKRIDSATTDSATKCVKCGSRLVPSRFVAACVNGHLEDFPYDWWVHFGKTRECHEAGQDNLEIEFSDKSSGLESIIIRCRICGQARSMAGCMGREALRGYRCYGKRPWLGKIGNEDPKECTCMMRALQRGASNIYFAQTQSALTIPDWGAKIAEDIEPGYEQYRMAVTSWHLPPEQVISTVYQKLIESNTYTKEEILEAIRKKEEEGTSLGEYTEQMLNEDEFRMLSGPDQDTDVFHSEHITEIPDFLKDYVSDIVLLKRLREVVALKGFRRIYPGKPTQDEEKFEGWNQQGDCVPLSDKPLGWLPATEMKGEGIFIQMNLSRLEQWAAEHEKDYEVLKNNLAKSKMVECKNYSTQYVMLHTLSHLLIRQLSIECGYSGAAIKERIYSTWPDSELKMAGILLYTSSSDSDGSLGGLVRKGLPDSMENLFRNLLQEASWCSSDPICINSPAQGMDSLNLAACHACTLLPETCCERRNCLLDRAAVVGKLNDRSRGFLSALMNK